MNKYFLLLVLAMPLSTHAKEPCPGVTRKVDKKTGLVSFISPTAPVIATKWVTKKSSAMFLSFSIQGGSEKGVVSAEDLSLDQMKGLSVQFSDATTWSSDSAIIRHHLRNGVSVFSYALRLDEKTLGLFTSKTISRFSLARLTQKDIAQAGRIPDYLRCMSR